MPVGVGEVGQELGDSADLGEHALDVADRAARGAGATGGEARDALGDDHGRVLVEVHRLAGGDREDQLHAQRLVGRIDPHDHPREESARERLGEVLDVARMPVGGEGDASAGHADRVDRV